jgi:hypothetical protein
MSEGTQPDPGGLEPQTGLGSVLGWRIPADADVSVSFVVLRLRAVELSEAIGGGLLEEALTSDGGEGGYTCYVDHPRVAKGLPPNGRAAVSSARLGHVTRAWLADLQRFLRSAVLPVKATAGGARGGQR